MKAFHFFFGAILLFTGCASEPSNVTISSEGNVDIVFSADFDTNTGCAPHKTDGCDLYHAEIDLEGKVSSVQRLTDNEYPETFPVFSADGETVYANRMFAKTKAEIIWASLSDGTNGVLLDNALSPAPLPSGEGLVYLSQPSYTISLADFVDPYTLGGITSFKDYKGYHEAHVSKESEVVFHRLFGEGQGSNTAQVALFDGETQELSDLTEKDGTAHCFWHGNNAAVVCNNTALYRGLFTISTEAASRGVSSLLLGHPSVESIAALDPDFSVCKSTSYAYGNFCDEDHLIITVGCALEEDGVTDTFMSKLALVDFSVSPASVVILGNNLAKAYGGVGSSSYTVACH